ncbi:MAG: PspC domain-containing protein [Bacteroidales bacterium]|nr:PspC domain-containing protein [Bacteroidales bacterium]
MKVTVNINLGGYAFNVDDDAYERLRQYMKNLEKEFSGESSSAEIMSDIEGRIAELFRMKLNSYKQVITMKDVEEVMSILGTPEAISGGDPSAEEPPRGQRRIYRDPEGRIIGGVCSGLAAYFTWDPLIMRIIFVALVLAGGFGIALYLVLWIVLPEAKTTAQRLEMRGDPVTIENIKDSVKREFETVKKKMNL